MSLNTATLKYYEIAKVNYRHATAYLFDTLSVGIMVAIRTWVLAQLYAVAYVSYQTTTIGGLTVAATVWSLAITNSLILSSGTRSTLYNIQEDIQSGNIAYLLGRPYSFLLYLYFSNWGRLIPRLMSMIVIIAIMGLLLVGPIHVSVSAVLASMLLAVIGLTLTKTIMFIFGLLSFWMEDVKALRWVYEKFQWAFGGLVVPLSLFPDGLRTFSEILPFAQSYYAPARIFVGFEPALFWKFLSLQLFWLIVCVIIMIWLFKKASKEISINGG